jgi:hypothetical protein
MKALSSRTTRLMASLLLCCFLTSSCATTHEEGVQQALGALGGAAFGALVGAVASGGNPRAIVAGAAAGAVVGLTAVALNQYQARQVRSAQDDQNMYGVSESVDKPLVKIRRVSCEPERVQPGQQIEISTDYSVALPPAVGQATVQEAWVLEKDGREIKQLGKATESRAAGGYYAGGGIKLASNMDPGTYTIKHKVSTDFTYDVVESVFYIDS